MKLTKKQVSLGVLSAVTIIAIPVATVVSCGSKEDKSDNIITDGNIGDAALQITSYSKRTPLMDLILNPYKGKYSFDFPQVNLNELEKNNKNNMNDWKTISKYRIIWSDSAKKEGNPNEYSKKEQYIVTSMNEFHEALNKINENIGSEVSKLSPLHKRTLLLANSEHITNEKGSSSIKNGYLEIKVYDTLKGDTLPQSIQDGVNSLVKNSNIVASSVTDYAKLDDQMSAPKKEDGSDVTPKEKLRRQWVRNIFQGFDSETFLLASNVVNGDIKQNPKDETNKLFTSSKYDEIKKEIDGNNDVEFWTQTYTNFQENKLKQKFWFATKAKTVEWKKDGKFSIQGFEDDKLGTVFSFSPTIIDFSKADGYFDPSEKSIFDKAQEQELAEFLKNQLEMIILGSGTDLMSYVHLLQSAMTPLNGYFVNAYPIIKHFVNFKNSVSKENTSKELDKIIKRVLPEIQSKFKTEVNYGKLLSMVNKTEKKEMRAGRNVLDSGKNNLVEIVGTNNADYDTQYILYFAPKILSDFSEILVKNWEK